MTNLNDGKSQNNIFDWSMEQKIDSLNGRHLTHEIFVHVLRKHTSKHNTNKALLANLPKCQSLFIAIKMLDDNVKNGGFYQYFNNSKGELIELCKEAIIAMDLSEISDIIESGNAIFLGNKNQSKISDADLKTMSNLDKEYYEFDKNQLIAQKMADYIKSNKLEFLQ